MSVTESADHRQQAFDRTAAARAALAEHQFATINVDIPTAVGAVLAAIPRIRPLTPRFAEVLPKLDPKLLDATEDYALAAQHAQLAYMATVAPIPGLLTLNEHALTLRDTLMSDAAALARRGLIDGKRLAEFKGLTGYRNVATELGGVTMVLRESWPEIQGKTALDPKELDEASALADQLLTAAFAREKASAATAAVTDTRVRAFTLLVRAYEELRAAVIYVRREEGDADLIAPSLYANRVHAHKAAETAPVVQPPAAAAPPSPGALPAGAPGTPDASPFTSS